MPRAVLLAICLLSFAAHADSAAVLKLGSFYVDEESKATSLEVGSGVLVDDPSKPNSQFLLTNAHLVQGNSPWVEAAGKVVKVKGVLSDAENDIAIVEIPRTGSAGAYYFDSKAEAGSETAGIYGIDGAFQPSRDLISKIKSGEAGELLPAANNGIAFVHPGWATQGAEPFDHTSKDKPNGSATKYTFDNLHTFAGTHSVVYAQVSPGDSGTLLMTERGAFKGIPTEYNLYFRRTTVAQPWILASLLEQYEGGKRGASALVLNANGVKVPPPKNTTRWKLRDGIFYLDFGNGFKDTNFDRHLAGATISGPAGGNGISSPPGGNGISSPPGGNGISSPPGAVACLDQNSHQVISIPADLIAAVSVLSRDDLHATPNEVYARHPFAPVMSDSGGRSTVTKWRKNAKAPSWGRLRSFFCSPT